MTTRTFKLPQHIDRDALERLTLTITELLEYGAHVPVSLAYDASNLQPTSRAAWLAANAAVNVLLAHEIGQEGKSDE